MKNVVITIVLFSLFVSGCEKNITIPQPRYDSRLSIECGLEVGVVPTLYLYKTVPYFNTVDVSQLFVKDAVVKITNSSSADDLAIDSTYNYLKCVYDYFYKGKISVEANKYYQLTILYNGITYSASTNTNNTAVTIDSIGYTDTFKDIYGEHEGVIPYFHDIPNQANYYRYEMTRTVDTTMKYSGGKINSLCIGSGSVTVLEEGRSVYNDLNLNGGQVRLVIEPAFSHRTGSVGLVRIQTIDKVIYDFFDQLDRQKLGQLNPFVEPVFLSVGQFGNKAIGYFGSIARSAPVQFIFPD
jgi:hypothetical protein